MDVSSDGPAPQPSLGPTPEEAFLRYQRLGPWAVPFPLSLPTRSSVPVHVPLSTLAASSLPLATLDSQLPQATLCCPFPSPCLSLLFLLSFPPPSFSLALLLPVLDWLPATPVFSVCSGIGWPSELEPPAPESPMALLADPAPAAE